MHAQIVADTLGVPYDAIEVNAADTGEVPDSGPTVASRTCMIVGRILQRCAEEMRDRLGRLTPREYLRRHGPLVITEGIRAAVGHVVGRRDLSRRRVRHATAGRAMSSNSKSIPTRGRSRPVEFTTVHEIGKAIHPLLAVGQIEGGSAQGLGYALLEDVVMRDGRMANAQLTNYIIPTTLDTPTMRRDRCSRIRIQHGPFGAKGVGEMPIDGPAPAVINALRHAGLRPARHSRDARTDKKS